MCKSKIQNKLPTFFNINEKQITDKKEIAEQFNNFFINIGPKLASELDTAGKPDFKSYLNMNKLKTVFNFTPIEEEQTKTIITNLKPKNSSGHDNISLILLKASINSIAKPLTCIINQSLKTGRFPSKLKVAKIIPIFKKDVEHDFNNYRPISLLPSISKVFEKTIYTQLFQYITVNSLLHANQYGFRAKYCITLYFRGRKISRKVNLKYFREKIFSRIYCSRENFFPRKYLPAKISSRENILSRKYLPAKII